MNFAFNFLNLIYGDIKYGDVTAAVQENVSFKLCMRIELLKN